MLLLVESLDMLLDDQVASEDGWALRQALQTEPDLLLMATAVTTFAEVEQHGKALYGFFHRLDLAPLDDDGVRILWRNVTGVELEGDRVVPVRILTGGDRGRREETGRQRYELTERLYNLYHLLRRAGGEGRVRSLVDTLLGLYGPTEARPDVFAPGGKPLPRELREALSPRA